MGEGHQYFLCTQVNPSLSDSVLSPEKYSLAIIPAVEYLPKPWE